MDKEEVEVNKDLDKKESPWWDKGFVWIGALILIGAIVSNVAESSPPDDVDRAYQVCAAANATGLLSQKCSVFGYGSSVDIHMVTTASEARKICAGIASVVSAEGIRFVNPWRLKIYSPYSNDNTIAQCRL
jgi:hypothetical protein